MLLPSPLLNTSQSSPALVAPWKENVAAALTPLDAVMRKLQRKLLVRMQWIATYRQNVRGTFAPRPDVQPAWPAYCLCEH